MDQAQKYIQLDRDESEILEYIVDAMFEAQDELRVADADQWQAILTESCRRHRRDNPSSPLMLLASC